MYNTVTADFCFRNTSFDWRLCPKLSRHSAAAEITQSKPFLYTHFCTFVQFTLFYNHSRLKTFLRFKYYHDSLTNIHLKSLSCVPHLINLYLEKKYYAHKNNNSKNVLWYLKFYKISGMQPCYICRYLSKRRKNNIISTISRRKSLTLLQSHVARDA